MEIELDHLVVTARTLEEGVDWVEQRVGVPMGPGGKHVVMGTHNRLLSLGPGRFLEVIAIDPDAAAPARPRWFGLDEPETRSRLHRGPALLHWVVRSDDIAATLAALGGEQPEILSLSRGDYRWRIGVAAHGKLAMEGTVPTVIQWEGTHPAEHLPESGCRLERLVLSHPKATEILAALHGAGLRPEAPVEARPRGAPALQATGITRRPDCSQAEWTTT